MKTWKKIALGVVALGLIGKMFGGDDAQQPQRETITVDEQPKQERNLDEINVDFVKNNFKDYTNYTYMRDEVYGNANSLADAKKYGGKVQIPHMRLVGVEGDYIGMESDDGCKLLLKNTGEFKDYILTYAGGHDENLVFVTLERVGGRDDKGHFIYVGTIDYITETRIGGIQ